MQMTRNPAQMSFAHSNIFSPHQNDVGCSDLLHPLADGSEASVDKTFRNRGGVNHVSGGVSCHLDREPVIRQSPNPLLYWRAPTLLASGRAIH